MKCFIDGEKVKVKVVRYFNGDMRRLVVYKGKEYMTVYRDGKWQEMIMPPRPEPIVPPQGGTGVMEAKHIINDACMYFRHDFGLLEGEEQKMVLFEAKEWLYAWAKAIEDTGSYGIMRIFNNLYRRS